MHPESDESDDYTQEDLDEIRSVMIGAGERFNYIVLRLEDNYEALAQAGVDADALQFIVDIQNELEVWIVRLMRSAPEEQCAVAIRPITFEGVEQIMRGCCPP